MSSIGKEKPKGNIEFSLSDLKSKFSESAEAIRVLQAKTSDRAVLDEINRGKLRRAYSVAAQYAKSIADREPDDKTAEEFKEKFKRLSDKAATYGSVIRGEIPDTTMDDVKGLDDVKELIKSFIFMAKRADLVQHYKIKGGLGMLMYGAPGTGKTMFAEAVANAMQLPLFIVTPADIFKSYVGESEQSVKLIFQEIEACVDGAILFVDECESIFSRRTSDTKDYKSAVTTELLQRMNGFGINDSKRIMIAATNRPDEIDPAYLRYKRFSHLVKISPPDTTAKRAIIESKLKGIRLSEDVSIDDILEMTEATNIITNTMGIAEQQTSLYSAADLCGIIEEACRTALMQIEERKLDAPIPLTREMFTRAFAKIPPSISRKSLALYDNFMTDNNII